VGVSFEWHALYIVKKSELWLSLQKIMEGISYGDEVGGAGGASSYSSLKRLDEQWWNLRNKRSGIDFISILVFLYVLE
jgi:hypothetical protein